jgi:hypothetical protein
VSGKIQKIADEGWCAFWTSVHCNMGEVKKNTIACGSTNNEVYVDPLQSKLFL